MNSHTLLLPGAAGEETKTRHDAALPYAQDVRGCLAAGIGPAGLARGEMNEALAATESALARLREEVLAGEIPALSIVLDDDDMDAYRLMAQKLASGAKDIVLFGIGGSALAPRVLVQLAGYHAFGDVNEANLHVMDNPETPWMERFISRRDLEGLRFLVISKSGSTAETLMQMLWAIDYLQVHGLGSSLAQRMLVVTEPSEPRDNPLRRLAAAHGIPVLPHPADIGGRYSAFSVVGMLPAFLLGLDAAKIRAGGRKVLQLTLDEQVPAEANPPALGAAVLGGFMRADQLSSLITMPYTSQLTLLNAWWRQLWAESIGKEGIGPLPVSTIGPVDQHSQLQLFLDGPNDKLFTLIMPNSAGKGYRAPRALMQDADERLACLGGRTIGDLTDCEQRATAKSLMRKGRPVRTFSFDVLDEELIGALFMHFMVETILSCRLMGIDPFDQPAVEFSKRITRELLREIDVPDI